MRPTDKELANMYLEYLRADTKGDLHAILIEYSKVLWNKAIEKALEEARFGVSIMGDDAWFDSKCLEDLKY